MDLVQEGSGWSYAALRVETSTTEANLKGVAVRLFAYGSDIVCHHGPLLPSRRAIRRARCWQCSAQTTLHRPQGPALHGDCIMRGDWPRQMERIRSRKSKCLSHLTSASFSSVMGRPRLIGSHHGTSAVAPSLAAEAFCLSDRLQDPFSCNQCNHNYGLLWVG